MGADEAVEGKDCWQPFHYFLGSWTGTGTGKAGESTGERSYELTLANQFILVRSRSVFLPQEGSPSGEVHEDLGLISYDKARDRYVLREFHVEGYVNQYVMEPPGEGERRLVFVTEAIENIPPGWRARITLEVLSADSFREVFELAGPGKEWSCFVDSELHRAR